MKSFREQLRFQMEASVWMKDCKMGKTLKNEEKSYKWAKKNHWDFQAL